MKNIVIVGATSTIAIAGARERGAKGARFVLVARDQDRMDQVAVHRLNVDTLDDHPAMLADCAAQTASIELALVARGMLPDQSVCQNDRAVAVRDFHTNALSLIAVLTRIASRLFHCVIEQAPDLVFNEAHGKDELDLA